MKNSYLYIFIGFILIVVIAFAIYYFTNNNATAPNSQNTTRLATEVNVKNEIEEPKEPVEVELSSFSTTISSRASGRLNNIRITCERLNGMTISNGDTFSFCETLGPATEEQGYEEADVIAHGDIIQALGGGKCQVSSTLYNAVLEAGDGLEVIERHPHGKPVGYVPEGRDAAISYGSMDLKFKNNTGSDIKMYFSSDDYTITVRLAKLEVRD